MAHDNKKRDLLESARFNRNTLAAHVVYATGTTGSLLEQALDFEIIKLQSGPLGGDQQLGARITDSDIDFLIFFWDPLEPPLPHDPDVKALHRSYPLNCRLASTWSNSASASAGMSSSSRSGGS